MTSTTTPLPYVGVCINVNAAPLIYGISASLPPPVAVALQENNFALSGYTMSNTDTFPVPPIAFPDTHR